jgi:hypothetical protein
MQECKRLLFLLLGQNSQIQLSWDGGGRAPLSFTFLAGKILKERPSAQTQSFMF